MNKYDFILKETDGKDISLKDYKGKNVVLYFYPKDNTPGWTTEAQEFMEFHKKFEDLNTVILGISKDSLKSHEKFRDKYKWWIQGSSWNVWCNETKKTLW